jgi:hypothetical protein
VADLDLDGLTLVARLVLPPPLDELAGTYLALVRSYPNVGARPQAGVSLRVLSARSLRLAAYARVTPTVADTDVDAGSAVEQIVPGARGELVAQTPPLRGVRDVNPR